MTDLPFVDWDRGTEWIYEGRRCMNLYGWIDREEDEYKDFVLIGVYEQEEVEEADVAFHGTSSAKYSEEIHERLFPDEDVDEMHNDCFRLEDAFDVPNMVRVQDGGENHES